MLFGDGGYVVEVLSKLRMDYIIWFTWEFPPLVLIDFLFAGTETTALEFDTTLLLRPDECFFTICVVEGVITY